MSVLLDAIEHFNEKQVWELLESGADPNVRGFAGITPLHLAIDVEAEDALWRYDRNDDETPADGRLVRLLIIYDADIQARDEAGRTPLEWAKARNHTAAIKAIMNTHLALGRVRNDEQPKPD